MLTIDDFKLRRIACELRYPDAYLIFDKAGHVFHSLRKIYPTLAQVQSSPNLIQMKSADEDFTLELGQCRVMSDRKAANIEQFTVACVNFFGLALGALEIQLFTRIGLRSIYVRRHENPAEARKELRSLQFLQALDSEPRFGAEHCLKEITVKWEGGQIGGDVHLKAETATLDAKLPAEFEPMEIELHREVHYVLLDVDYYTVATVERSQWDAASWVPQSYRIARKEGSKLLNTI